MNKIMFTTTLVAAICFQSLPSFANGYIVNGEAASDTQLQFLVSHGFQPGAWVMDGYGIGPANTNTGVQQAVDSEEKKCRYVLEVLLCN